MPRQRLCAQVLLITFLVRDLLILPKSLNPDLTKISSDVKTAGGSKAGLKVTIWNEKQLHLRALAESPA